MEEELKEELQVLFQALDGHLKDWKRAESGSKAHEAVMLILDVANALNKTWKRRDK